ncbi:MAG: zinc metalloprotease [Ferruginibacter sp.]
MKKLFGLLSCAVVLGIGCTKISLNEDSTIEPTPAVTSNLTHRGCASEEVLQQQLKDDPTLAARMEAIESFTAKYQQNPSAYRLLANGIIEIPVVVNVVYYTEAENISAAQIRTQIDVLNKDFSGTNSDIGNVPTIFRGVKAGDVGVRFVLDNIIRRSTFQTSFSTDNGVKKGSTGGIAPTSPTTKLNMWSCNLGGGVRGYSQYPGGASATDGVVISYRNFGVTTEVGHWLNLRHIWGGAVCGNDFVTDTPLHTGANRGCPASGVTSSCTGSPVMMTMNYMDYTDDLCMYMFSAGQKTRMFANFVAGGARTSFSTP